MFERLSLFAAGFLVVFPFQGCGRSPSRSQTIHSPDGSLVLATSVETSQKDPRKYLCIVLEIRDKTGKLLHSENSGASATMRWQVSWLANDRIRLDSSDIGAFHWQQHPDGSWKKE